MSDVKGISIILPAYNEEAAIPAVLDCAVAAAKGLAERDDIDEAEIIVVDDGSTDATSEIAARYEGVNLIKLTRNIGYGGALKRGISEARFDVIAFHDADGTCDTGLLGGLVDALNKSRADMVIGARLGKGSKMPLTRTVGNRIFALLLSFLGSARVTDSASGMRVFTREAYEKLLPLPDGLNFTPAMSAKAIFEGLNIVEVPIPYAMRSGASKLNVIKDGVRFLGSILEVVKLYNPLKLFGIAGILFGVIAIALGIMPVRHYIANLSLEEDMIYRLLTVAFLAIWGLFLVLVGVVANRIVEIHRGSKPARTSMLGRFIYSPRIYRKLIPAGAVILLIGASLLIPSFLERITTGHIYHHWSWFVLSFMLMTLGIQLVGLGYLVDIMSSLVRDNRE